MRNGVYFRRDERAPKKGVAIGFGFGSDCAVSFETDSIDVDERNTRKGVSEITKHKSFFWDLVHWKSSKNKKEGW